tara:strand:+ start:1534 stop:1782 length:249 start_codon:yes stop_codon:yes gene_type:complete
MLTQISATYQTNLFGTDLLLQLDPNDPLLKQLENLSDEIAVVQWKRNPYYQAFCGMEEFQRALPCHSTELVHFRYVKRRSQS